MKTSTWIKLIGTLCIFFGALGIMNAIFDLSVPKLTEMSKGNLPELSPGALNWIVIPGYLQLLSNIIYLMAGIFFFMKKTYSLTLMYIALIFSILCRIVPMLFFNRDISVPFSKYDFNIMNLIGPFIDISLLIGVFRLSKYYYKSTDELNESSEENNTTNTLRKDSSTFKNSITSKIVFLMSILVSVYWVLPQVIDVYHFNSGGAIFEILWLPMIGLLFTIPIMSLVFLLKEKFSFRSLNLYSLFIVLTVILIMVFVRK